MSQVKQITPVGVVPKAWVKSTLESVSEFITKGSTPTTFGFDWVESGIPFLRSECVTDNGFNMKGLSYISNEAHEYMVRSKIVAGDILISITGNVGRIAIFPKELVEGNINQHIARVRINEPNECDEGFVYYQINQVLYRQYYYGIVTGAAYPQLSLKQIRETPIYLPPLPTQKRIASILSAYDDLIENNLKRIKLLEEIAQRTYEEWFVKYRVNGEQLAIDEATGLPDGWMNVELGSFLIKLESGGRPKGGIDKDLKNGIPSIGAENVLGLGQYKYGNEKIVTKSFFEKMRKGIVEDKDILVYKDGAYIGKTSMFQDGFPHEVCAVNEHVFLINTGKSELQNYLFFTLNRREYFMKMQSLNSNAAQPGINQEKLKSLEITIPTLNIINDYHIVAEPLTKQIFKLAKINDKLKQSRDILLPRLMSGTINVES